jgi:hypothetical protein
MTENVSPRLHTDTLRNMSQKAASAWKIMGALVRG